MLAAGVPMPAAAAATATPVPAPGPPVFPAQQRKPGDPALVARGNALYGSLCRGCHGVDLRGGDLGGPNLLRSQLVLNDEAGEAIGAVILQGRTPAGGGTAMPALPLTPADIRAVAEYVHSVAFMSQPQGAPPPSNVELNLLVGNARKGQAFFGKECASCHSPTGDLAGIATRTGTVELLQNAWVAGRRTPPSTDAARRTPRVTVRLAGGESISGALMRLDDFVVALRTDAGDYRSFTRRAINPRIEDVTVDDPLAKHRDLWTRMGDGTMHDVTAYLATLK